MKIVVKIRSRKEDDNPTPVKYKHKRSCQSEYKQIIPISNYKKDETIHTLYVRLAVLVGPYLHVTIYSKQHLF